MKESNKLLKILILIISGITLFYSGKHLFDVGSITSLFDALILGIFFISAYPFIQLISILLVLISNEPKKKQ